MSSSVIPGPGSVVLSVTRPYEDDGVTPRDDLIGMKVWVSLTDGFSPVNLDNAQVLAPIYDGPGLSCSITGLDPGVTYYVRYALISSIDPDYLEVSDQVACVPTEPLDGESAITLVFSNESHTFPAATSGAISSYVGSGLQVTAFEGSSPLSASNSGLPGTFSVGAPAVAPSGIAITPGVISMAGLVATVAAHSAIGATMAVLTLTFPVTVVRADGTVMQLSRSQTLTKATTGATGTAGAAATAYWMLKSAGAIAKSIAAVYTPTAVTFSAMSQTGAGAAAAYAGRYIIATSTDGVAFTDQYTSAANEASKAYTVPAGIKAIRARLYAAGGVTTLLDEELVPVVTDGATGATGTAGLDGAPGEHAVSGVLSNESHTVPADSAGTVTSFAGAVTSMSVFLGTVDDTANWTFSVTKTNVTCTEATTSRTQTVTAMSADAGYVDIAASRSGYASVTKRFVVSKAKAGATGAGGATGATGSAGAAATAYWMLKSAGAIAKSIAAVYTPTAVTFSAMSQTGAGAAAAYAGRYIIATSTDGVAFTNQYTSAANEASKAYTVPAGIKAIRARLYAAGGVTTLLDEELVPVVTDGATGAGGAQGATGATGAQGPSVVLVASRAGSFTSTDGTLDASQTDITFTALVNGIASPTFAWTLSGFQTAPTASTTNSQTITAAQFGTAKSATVKCTVNGNSAYVDMATVVRLEKSTAVAGANKTSVDANGTIQGVSSGAGTPVSNQKITLSKGGILSGAGTSEQLDITHIPGTLSVDRLLTGTLSATERIIVGSDSEGLVIDGGSRAITAKAKRQWATTVFSLGYLSSITPVGSPWTGIPPGFFNVPQPGWTSATSIYMYRVTIGVDGLVKSCSVDVAGGNSQNDDRWSFANVPSAKTIDEIKADSSIVWHYHTLPATPAGHSVWARRYYLSGRQVSLANSYLLNVSEDTVEDLGTYSPVKFGNLGASYGIEGVTDKNVVSFKLDNNGLYITPTSESLWAFGAAYGWKTLVEDTEIQVYTGASSGSTGTVTTYIKLLDSADFTTGETHRIFASVIGVFDRNNWNTFAVTYEFNSRYFSTQLYESSAGVITSMGDVSIAADTTASTNFPATKASIVVDADGTLTGEGAGVYLKLVSRTMYDSTNATYGDWTRWKYVVWSLEGA